MSPSLSSFLDDFLFSHLFNLFVVLSLSLSLSVHVNLVHRLGFAAHRHINVHPPSSHTDGAINPISFQKLLIFSSSILLSCLLSSTYVGFSGKHHI